MFVEYVERDSIGTPINVYVTQANGWNTLNYGVYDPGYDGVVEKMTFDEFTNRGNTLVGYIAAK